MIEALTKIDELGALEAQIEVLQAKAKKIKDEIKEEASMTGQRIWEGEKYEALFTASNVSTVNWANITKILNIPAELIAQNTKTSARYSVKCEPKKVK